MASGWAQPHGGPPPNQTYGPPQPQPQPQRRNTNPPPVCFTCGGPHFVVACPQARANPGGFGPSPAPAPTPPPYQQYPPQAPPVPHFQPRPGPPQPQFSPYPQNQQYGPQVPQPPYGQPYGPPAPVNPHHPLARPGQSVPFNQGPPPNPPHYGNQSYPAPVPQQPYRPPVPPPYQPPQNPYPPQNAGYQAQPPQWNTQPPQSFPRPAQRSASFTSPQRGYSATPSNNSQYQHTGRPQQATTQQFQPPQVPAPAQNLGRRHSTALASPTKAPEASRGSSPGSAATVQPSPHEHQSGPGNNSDKHPVRAATAKNDEPPEDGEVTELDDEEEQWEWDNKTIFNSPVMRENVSLAQPLAESFKSTPVPLIQTWNTSVPSISRYATKTNVKDYCRSVRDTPQWSYMKEDPAFVELKTDAPLIPLDEVHAWTAARRQTFDDSTETIHGDAGPSRKRSRTDDLDGEEAEQEDVDNQIKFEAARNTQPDFPPNKRQKNVDDQLDELMETNGSRTPILAEGRGGTPYLPTDDAAWAPEPGERASSPGDPTEALLASLGVTGSPKPVEEEILLPYTAENHSPLQNTAQDPQISQSGPTPSRSSQTPRNSQNGSLQPPSSSNPPHTRPPSSAPTQANYPQTNGPQMNNGRPGTGDFRPNQASQGFHENPQYQPQPPSSQLFPNGPNGMNPSNQYGPPNQPYNYAPPANNYTQPPHHTFPQQPPYQSPGPYQGPQPYPHSLAAQHAGPHMGPQVGHQMQPFGQHQQPYTSSYGPGSSYGPPSHAPPYQAPQHPSFGNGVPSQAPYGSQNMSPAQYGPPINQSYGPQYPNQPQASPPNFQYQNGPANNPHFPNSQRPFPNGQMPPRQDSGYVSARGSYSNGSGPANSNNQANGPYQVQTSGDINQNASVRSEPDYGDSSNPKKDQTSQGSPNGAPQDQNNPQNQANFNDRNGVHKENQHYGFDGQNDSAPQIQSAGPIQGGEEKVSSLERESQVPQKSGRRKSGCIGENGSMSVAGESPLSPTSAELLGMLENKSNPVKTENPKRREESRRKKPQPVVAEAYSRRW